MRSVMYMLGLLVVAWGIYVLAPVFNGDDDTPETIFLVLCATLLVLIIWTGLLIFPPGG